MTVGPEPEREQLFGVPRATCNFRTGHQPQGNGRRARPEPAGARNAFREREAEAVGRRKSRKGADGEMAGIDVSTVFAELELVPEIERRPGAVETRPEIGRGCRGADVDHEPGSRRRSSAPGSFSPCPVRTSTTRVPSARLQRSTPASAAAEAGSQKTPCPRARDLQAIAISSSVTETIAPPERASASSTSARWTGVGIRIAEAVVAARSAASTGTISSAGNPPSREPFAYATVLPPRSEEHTSE